MLVVQSSFFAICFPSCIFHSNNLPMSLCLCWIRGTGHIRLLGVYSVFIGSICRSWSTRYIVYEEIISWLADWWPFRHTSWSWTMMAGVDCSLQMAQSYQAMALNSSRLSDIVDGLPEVNSRWIISFCRSSTQHVSIKCWQYSRKGQWTCIQIHLDVASGGDMEPQWYLFESELTQVGKSHSQPYRTMPNAGKG